jgi:hypothetical protein
MITAEIAAVDKAMAAEHLAFRQEWEVDDEDDNLSNINVCACVCVCRYDTMIEIRQSIDASMFKSQVE